MLLRRGRGDAPVAIVANRSNHDAWPPVVAGLVGIAHPRRRIRPVLRDRIARGESSYPDSSDDAEKLLRNAANLARDHQWSEAINIYQRVIDQFGDKVAMCPKRKPAAVADSGFVLYVHDRSFCHAAIAQFPPEARAIYRNRVDGIGSSAGSAREPKSGISRLLRRVVDQAFCSSWGDDALELLGDLAFQDGRFGEALACIGVWCRTVPATPVLLVHPDPSVDLVQGLPPRKLLCRAAAGEDAPAKAEIERVRAALSR